MLKPQPAIYLRCYPVDRWEMQAHRRALEMYARRLGLSVPAVYLDNGCSVRHARPAFESLRKAVTSGLHRVVMVPGPWVFGLDPTRAATEIDRLAADGCEIVELPHNWTAPPRRTGLRALAAF